MRRNGHQYHHRVFIAVAIQNGVIRPEVNIKVLHIHHISELIRRMNGVNGVNGVRPFIINPAVVITNYTAEFINLIVRVDITELETFPQRVNPGSEIFLIISI